MNLYSVLDKRAKNFGAPFAAQTHVHALRSITQEVNRSDSGNMLNQYPEDFALYCVGEFNQDSGELQPRLDLVVEASATKRPEGK